MCRNWRASEASETLSGVTNGNQIYIYIYMVRARHFSIAGPVLRNVGGVKCQPFLNLVTIGNELLKCFKKEPCALVTV